MRDHRRSVIRDFVIVKPTRIITVESSSSSEGRFALYWFHSLLFIIVLPLHFSRVNTDAVNTGCASGLGQLVLLATAQGAFLA